MQYFGTARIGKTQSIPFSTTIGTIPTGVSIGVNRIHILVTSDAFITIDGSDPTVGGAPLTAGNPEYFTVAPGEKPKAIQISAAGTMYVTECA